MFGGGLCSATEARRTATITETAAAELGQDALHVLVASPQDCVTAGRSTSSDPLADASRCGGRHGLAHQRVVSPQFP